MASGGPAPLARMYREQLCRRARSVGTVGLLPGLNGCSFETEEYYYYIRVPQVSPKVTVLGADRPFEHLPTSSTANQTYPKTDMGPNDDNGTAGATGLGLYV